MLLNAIVPLHRILGELLLLLALIGVTLAIIGLVRKKELERPEKIFAIVYSGLLDLQALLGVVYYFLLSAPARPSILHPAFMILAVVIVHVGRRWRNSPLPTRHWAQLGVYGASLLLVLVGRLIVA